MAITFGYTSLTSAKEWLGIPAAATDEDALVEALVTGASRSIDEHCRRRFHAVTETRYYTPSSAACLRLDQDLRSITTLKTDADGDRTFEITWATTDYLLAPYNAIADGLPYDTVHVDRNGAYSFPITVARAVEIVGSWGFCATGAHPALIEEACLLTVARQYARKAAPLGVAGSPEAGFVQVPLDRDIRERLWPYIREAVTA